MKTTHFLWQHIRIVFLMLFAIPSLGFLSFLHVSTLTPAQAHVNAITSKKDIRSNPQQQNVYTVDYDQTIVKLDGLSGLPLWRFALPKDQGMPLGELQVHNETLYVTFLNMLIALNANTGNERWHINFDEHTTLQQVLLDKHTLYLRLRVQTETQISNSYKALKDNGKELWHVTGFKPSVVAFLLGDTIYWNTGKGATNLYALDVRTAKLRWTQTGKALPFAGSLIVHRGIIYGTSFNTLFALNEADGTIRWQQKSSNEQLWWDGLHIDHNQLFAGEEFWNCFHQPQVCIDSLHMVALDPNNGSIQWASAPGYGIGMRYVFSPTLFTNNQYVLVEHSTTTATYIAALDRATGNVQWETLTCESSTCRTAWNGIKNKTFYRLQSAATPDSTAVLQSINTTKGTFHTYPTTMLVDNFFKVTEANGLLYTRGQKNASNTENPTYVIQAMQLNDATIKWTYEMKETTPEEVYTVSSPVIAP